MCKVCLIKRLTFRRINQIVSSVFTVTHLFKSMYIFFFLTAFYIVGVFHIIKVSVKTFFYFVSNFVCGIIFGRNFRPSTKNGQSAKITKSFNTDNAVKRCHHFNNVFTKNGSNFSYFMTAKFSSINLNNTAQLHATAQILFHQIIKQGFNIRNVVKSIILETQNSVQNT